MLWCIVDDHYHLFGIYLASEILAAGGLMGLLQSLNKQQITDVEVTTATKTTSSTTSMLKKYARRIYTRYLSIQQHIIYHHRLQSKIILYLMFS